MSKIRQKVYYNCPLCGSNDYEHDPQDEPYLRCKFCGYTYAPGKEGERIR